MRRMNTFRADFLLGLRLFYHSRLLGVIFWFSLLILIGFYVAVQFSARQMATVSMDVGISIVRLVMPILIVLLVQELFGREFERKLYLSSFAYPRSRTIWLLSRLWVILAIVFVVLACFVIVLAALSAYAMELYHQATAVSLGLPYLVTVGMLALDLTVVTVFAVLLAVSARTPSFVLLGVFGFVLIARSYTPLIELLSANPYVVEGFADPRIYRDSIGMLAFLLPDLGRLDVRMIALYNDMAFFPSDWALMLSATLAYVAALLGLSVWVLNKREFN
jgi:Cu-processing system permease protein